MRVMHGRISAAEGEDFQKPLPIGAGEDRQFEQLSHNLRSHVPNTMYGHILEGAIFSSHTLKGRGKPWSSGKYVLYMREEGRFRKQVP